MSYIVLIIKTAAYYEYRKIQSWNAICISHILISSTTFHVFVTYTFQDIYFANALTDIRSAMIKALASWWEWDLDCLCICIWQCLIYVVYSNGRFVEWFQSVSEWLFFYWCKQDSLCVEWWLNGICIIICSANEWNKHWEWIPMQRLGSEHIIESCRVNLCFSGNLAILISLMMWFNSI